MQLIGLFVSLKDPSRNHRAYRLTVAKLEPPLIPFMPLLIKGKSEDVQATRGGVCGQGNEHEPNQIDLLGKNDPILHLLPHASVLTSERAGKRTGEAGTTIWKP